MLRCKTRFTATTNHSCVRFGHIKRHMLGTRLRSRLCTNYRCKRLKLIMSMHRVSLLTRLLRRPAATTAWARDEEAAGARTAPTGAGGEETHRGDGATPQRGGRAPEGRWGKEEGRPRTGRSHNHGERKHWGFFFFFVAKLQVYILFICFIWPLLMKWFWIYGDW